MSLSLWLQWLSRKTKASNSPKRKRRVACKPSVEWLEQRLAPATITVTTAADDITPNDGFVSLREAITAINAGNNLGDPDIIAQNPGTFGTNDTINFNISAGGTVQTIFVGTDASAAGVPLPTITKAVLIDGYTEPGATANTLANGDNAKILIELNGAGAGPFADGLAVNIAGASATANATIRGLAINRFTDNGILLLSGFNTVTGNFVGLNPLGTVAEPNAHDGIRLDSSSNNAIGGITPDARNIISGNTGDGIGILHGVSGGFDSANNVVEGNFIGTDVTGTLALGNATNGVYVTGSNNTFGGNFIAFNSGAGVNVNDDSLAIDSAINNAILGNSIFANSKLGIDLGGNGVTLNDSSGHKGPNHFQNFPVLSSVLSSPTRTTVQGTLSGNPSTNFTVEFYYNVAADPSGFGQGQTFFGRTTVTTDTSGNASFTVTFVLQVPAGYFITATATDPSNNTSEFSQAVLVQFGTINVTGIAFCAKESVPLNNAAVATFTDTGIPQPAGNTFYAASINWGDGTPLTTGIVTGSGSTFTVLGTHTYAAEEFYTVTVLVRDRPGRSGTESLTVLVGGFVTSLYQDVLNRLPDRPGLDSWVQQLHAGTLNRQQVASGFLTSQERRGLEVDLYYSTFLFRGADPVGRQGWVQQLMAGVSESEVLVGILTSPEFTASHPDSTSFVQALFVGVFNRTGGASEVSFWQQRLDSGAQTRAAVIRAFLSSTEAYNDAIDDNYLTFLDRRPDPAGQQGWFSLIVSGQLTPTTFSAAILGSVEYLALALACPPLPT